MDWKPRPIYQCLPEIYLVVSCIFFLGWNAAFIVPLPEDLNPDGVLRMLVIGFSTSVVCFWGVLGILLYRYRFPTIDLGMILCSNLPFTLLLWMAQLEYRPFVVIIFDVLFGIYWGRAVWRVFISARS
jgi:hypothetical protein